MTRDVNGSGKRIAKNTAFLYVRMMIVMIVTLYTSRVILNVLGETDYGIYNVIGGVVTMMVFLNGALASSTSRFLTYELGRRDTERLRQTFSASLNLHIAVALLVIILGETVGLWFFYNKLVIPPERMEAAFWVYQFSIVTTVFGFTQVPYNASIISHENMSVYAYIGLYEAVSKLLIAYVIGRSPIDQLVFYGLLLMLNAVLIQLFYRWYTYRRYEECRWRWVTDRPLYRRLLGYSGWDMFGNIAVVCQGQGINILLNLFFGPVVNTARAIALQMQTGLKAFVSNFLVAVRPQVIKRFAEGDCQGMYRLTFYASKAAYLLMLALMLPVCFEMDFVLHFWLGENVPEQTKVFAWIILAIALTDTFHSAYLMSYHAIGRIRTGNLIGGSMMIAALPIGYVVLRFGFPAYSVFVVILVMNLVSHVISWGIVYRYVKFSINELLRVVYFPCLRVTLLSVIPPLLIVRWMESGWPRFFLLLGVTEIVYVFIIYWIGFSASERETILWPVIRMLKSALKR